jgi:hypothetical protein
MATCNTCALTEGFVDNCEFKAGGGNYVQLSIMPSCYIDTVTQVSGVITAITLDTVANPLAQWYTVKVRKDTLSTQETVNLPSGTVQQTIVFSIANYSDNADKETAAAEQAEFLNALVNNDEGMVVVIRDKAGVRRFYGLTTGLSVSAVDKNSGLASTDLAGAAITLTEVQAKFAPSIDAAVVNDNIILPS